MAAIRQILSTILIATVLISGLPLASLEDANRDRRVDLKDAILQVKEFSRLVDQPEAFSSSVEKVVETFNVVAGFKPSIRQTGKTESATGSYYLDPAYLIQTNGLLPVSIQLTKLPELSVNVSSITIVPDSPPPRAI